jgi:DNA-binding MarR family transcriptional regulator
MIDEIDSFLTELAEMGVRNTSQILMLLELGRNEFAPMTVLAKTAQVSTAAVTGAVDAMEKAGVVNRCSGQDRRVWMVELTDKGEALMRKHGLLVHDMEAVPA